MVGDRVKNPDGWYLQYAALIWKKKKIIYVSAISWTQPTNFVFETIDGTLVLEEKPSDDWKKYATKICDGGTNWGVIYDVAKGKFSDLAVNGI